MEDEKLIEDCEEVLDVPSHRGGPGFTDWEREFIQSVRGQVDDGNQLSAKQREKLRELWERV